MIKYTFKVKKNKVNKSEKISLFLFIFLIVTVPFLVNYFTFKSLTGYIVLFSITMFIKFLFLFIKGQEETEKVFDLYKYFCLVISLVPILNVALYIYIYNEIIFILFNREIEIETEEIYFRKGE